MYFGLLLARLDFLGTCMCMTKVGRVKAFTNPNYSIGPVYCLCADSAEILELS